MNRRTTTPLVSAELTRRSLLGGAAGLAGLLVAGCGTGSGNETASSASGGSGKPTTGGRLRVGVPQGGPQDTLSPWLTINEPDIARVGQIYEPLVRVNSKFEQEMLLAESFEPNKDATTWTIRLKKGVVWHDGKPLTADDLIYTISANLDPKNAAFGASRMDAVDLKGLRKLDNLTVLVPLTRPVVNLLGQFAGPNMSIVQDGTTDFTEPIGTGPFQYESFTPSQSSTFTAFADYHQDGRPYLDAVEIIDLTDDEARMNALLGGQVDAITTVMSQRLDELGDTGQFTLVEAQTNAINPIYMHTGQAPFDDVRVRTAFKLMADREQLLSVALGGRGRIANDMFGQGQFGYPTDVEQRVQDLDQAKSLLREAGYEGLKINLPTAAVAEGAVESATLFAEQARGAGVEITVEKVPADTYFGDKYLSYTLAQTTWATQPITDFWDLGCLPSSPFNETHWDNKEFISLFETAQSTVDAAVREEVMHEAQKVFFEDSGYLIWGEPMTTDATTAEVHDISTDVGHLGFYNFRDTWIQ